MPQTSGASRGVLRLALLAALAALALAGCRTERMVWRSRDEPAWRHWGETVAGGKRHYVGVALADNVLDEERARRRALTNAAARAAESLEVAVARVRPAIRDEEWEAGGFPAELLARASQEIRGLRAEDWYTENWLVRERPLARAFSRYKVFVLATYPEDEYQRVLSGLLASFDHGLPRYQMAVQSALDEQDAASALRHAEAAALRHPAEFAAWWMLHSAHKADGDMAGAAKALRRAESLAAEEAQRRAVQDALSETRDAAALAASEEASRLRSEGRDGDALDKMAEAWDWAADPGLRSRIAQEYYEAFTEEAAAAVRREAEARGLSPLRVADFLAGPSHSADEAGAFRASLARRLSEQGAEATLRPIGPEAARRLMDGDWGEAPPGKEREGVVLARLGPSLDVFLADPARRETASVAGGPALGAVRGRPDPALWGELNRLLPANPNPDFRAAVWTDRTQYRAGNRLRVRFRVSSDAYVYLVNLQTSGGAALLFPNAFHPDPTVRGGAEYAVPADDRYALQVQGPPGWEGLRLVATRKPLDLPLAPEDLAGGPADTGRQRDLVERLAQAVRALPPEHWTEAVWTFYIR